MKGLVWFTLMIPLTLAGCKGRTSAPAPMPSVSGVVASAPARPESLRVLGHSLDETRANLQRRYRLTPDRRLLEAVAYLGAYVKGAGSPGVETRFDGTAWHVSYEGTEVGTLPDPPSYEDGEHLLAGVAAVLLKEHPYPAMSGAAPDAPLPLFDETAFDTLQNAEALTADPAKFAAGVHLAAAAATSLAALVVDEMGAADELYARAWALVALDRVLGAPADDTRIRALLADALGYGADADHLAVSLPAEDPIRAHVTRDDVRFGALAAAPGTATALRVFWLERLLERRSLTEATEYRKKWLGGIDNRIPILLRRLDYADFASRATLAPQAPMLILLATARASGGPRAGNGDAVSRMLLFDDPDAAKKIAEGLQVRPEQVLSAFDEELDRFPRAKPAFAAGPILHTYFRAAMMSALHDLGGWYTETLASTPRAAAFAESLAKPPSATGKAFKSWYDYLVTARSGRNIDGALLDKIQGLTAFGARPLTALFDELVASVDYQSPLALTAARKLIARLDSRVEHRLELGNLAYRALLDLPLAERMYKNAIAAAPGRRSWFEAWFARFAADPELIARSLKLAELSPEDRLELLEEREKAKAASRDETRAAMRKVVAGDPDHLDTAHRYANYLTGIGEHQEAFDVVDKWLRAHPSATGLDPAVARLSMARSLRALGRDADALATIRPAMVSFKSDVLHEGSVLLSIAGETAPAELVARQRAERYPGAKSVAGLAEVLWRDGKPEDAATALATARFPLRQDDWSVTIGPAFADAFVRAKKPGADAALQALLRQRIDMDNVSAMLTAIAEADPKAAVDLLPVFTEPRLQAPLAVSAYRWVAQVKGDAAAAEWARPRLKTGRTLSVAAAGILWNEDAPLWLVDEPPPGEQRDLLWLFRGVTAAGKPARADELRRYFSEPGEGRYRAIGKVVVGLADEASILGLAGNIHEACEVAYYAGVAADARGRPADASDWYRAAMETNLYEENEYHFALLRLRAWRNTGKALDVAAKLKPR